MRLELRCLAAVVAVVCALCGRVGLPDSLAVAKTAVGEIRAVAGQMNVPARSAANTDTLAVVDQLGGESYALAMMPGLAFVGRGPQIVAVDTSDPASPLEIGSSVLFESVITRIAVTGDVLVVAAGSRIHIVDIEDPSLPTPRGYIDLASESGCQVLLARGHYAYVVERPVMGEDVLWILDVGNPDDPVPVANLPVDCIFGAALADDHILLACRGVLVVDVADPARPAIVGSFPEGAAVRMSDDGRTAYVINPTSGAPVSGHLRLEVIILDATNPKLLLEIGRLPIPDERIFDFWIDDGLLYLLRTGSLRILDLNAWPESRWSDEFDLGMTGAVAGGAVGRLVGVVSAHAGLRLLDAHDPYGVHHLDSLAEPAVFSDAALFRVRVFTIEGPTAPATGEDTDPSAVRAVDVSAEGSLQVGDGGEIGQPQVYLAAGDDALIAFTEAAVYRLSTSGTGPPQVSARYDSPDSVYWAGVSGLSAFILAGSDPTHLVRLDLARGDRIAVSGQFDIGQQATEAVALGDYVYVALNSPSGSGRNGLLALSAPQGSSAISEASYQPMVTYPRYLAATARQLFVASEVAGGPSCIDIYDLAEPRRPNHESRVVAPLTSLSGLYVAHEHLLATRVLRYYTELAVLNAADADRGEWALIAHLPGHTKAVADLGDSLVLAQSQAGLFLVSLVSGSTPLHAGAHLPVAVRHNGSP